MNKPRRIKDHPAPARRVRRHNPPPRIRGEGLPPWLRAAGQAQPVQQKAGRPAPSEQTLL